MNGKEKIGKIRGFVEEKLSFLHSNTNESAVRAELARLRRGIGKKPGELPELWELLLDDFPTELESNGAERSKAEWAIYTALTLFALHQQGKDIQREYMFQATDWEKKQYHGLGSAVGELAKIQHDRKDAIKRRFYVAVTAADLQGLSWHLRGIIQQLRGNNIPLDYSALATELYWYQYPNKIPDIRLRWGQDFYRSIEAKEKQAK